MWVEGRKQRLAEKGKRIFPVGCASVAVAFMRSRLAAMLHVLSDKLTSRPALIFPKEGEGEGLGLGGGEAERVECLHIIKLSRVNV